MKKIFYTSLAIASISFSATADVPFRILNQDEKAHTLKVKIDGEIKEITLEPNKAKAFNVEGKAVECTIVTSCGDVVVKSGGSMVIKDGCFLKPRQQ
jgi:hypothetical protein